MKMRRLIAASAIMMVAVAPVGAGGGRTGKAPAAGSSPAPPVEEAVDPAAGKVKYAASCAQCHGPSGRGMASFPSLRGRDAAYIASLLERYRAGEQIGPNSLLMIPMSEELTDQEISNLSVFISRDFR